MKGRHLDDWAPAKSSPRPKWANGIHNRKLKYEFSTDPENKSTRFWAKKAAWWDALVH